jgi:6-hydroxycyclohex-1-ene-1-carbonyl-CoA dehydrogenase
MKAAVYYGPHQPLKVEEVPTPQPGPGQILMKVAACGACHTDLHYIDHGVPTFKKPPLILGHEPSGTVAEVGEGVTNLKVGQAVLLPAVLTCGTCPLCRQGRENICNNMIMFGNHVDGAYAEYVLAPAKDAFLLPPEIPLVEGSIIADAISTPYHAVKNRAQVRVGDTVVVFGCGGVGINVVQMCAVAGATVIAVDINDKKLEWAKTFGAAYTLKAQDGMTVREIRKMTGGGADIAIEAIGLPATIEQAFDSVRTGGRLCIIGYTDKTINLSAAKIMFREIEVLGSLGCRPVDYPRLIEMARAGKIKVKEQVTHRFPLDKINEAFEVMKRGESLRSVIVP